MSRVLIQDVGVGSEFIYQGELHVRTEYQQRYGNTDYYYVKRVDNENRLGQTFVMFEGVEVELVLSRDLDRWMTSYNKLDFTED